MSELYSKHSSNSGAVANDQRKLWFLPAIPAEPASPVLTGSAAMAFRKH
jgi:hypothetical protein